MNEESKVSLPAYVYAMLRVMNNNNPELPPDELAKRALLFVPSMLAQLGVANASSQAELEEVLLRTFESFRKKPAGLNSAGSIFDPTWMDRLDKTNWKYWPNLATFLGEHLRPSPRSPESIAMLDACSDDVLRWAGPPDCVGLRKGLVLG